ncbi:MAG: hypothetical protein IT440_14425 [Phycisphaeraceae bacterium]|nr:hypothetical protein [Phycisphaeraceae bacterium]
MHEIARQLEQVRQLARTLLVAQRLAQVTAVGAGLAMLAAALDYALRLPGWLRLIVLAIVLAGGLYWLTVRLRWALRFAPSLTLLALRAEKVMPHLAGLLASSVDFGLDAASYDQPATTAAMAQASMAKAKCELGATPMRAVLDPGPAVRWIAVTVLILAAAAIAAAINPRSALLAFQRWAMPLSNVQWPRRTQVVSLMRDGSIWPSDTPLRLSAVVERGHHPSLRAWVSWRLVSRTGQPSPWSALLMNEQTVNAGGKAKRYEQLIDLPGLLTGESSDAGSLELFFEAGDHRTTSQRITLTTRPRLATLELHLTPPAYARGLIDEQTIDLDQAQLAGIQVATSSALAGSTVRWTMTFNKPLLVDQLLSLRSLMPGLADEPSAKASLASDATAGQPPATASSATVSLTLDRTVQTTIHLVDEHGLPSLSERLYRVEAMEDHAPAVTITLPTSDESVLPTATVNLEAVAQDDIGVERVTLAMTTSGTTEEQPLQDSRGRQARLGIATTLDLAPLKLQPGDEVQITAAAQDVYELHNQRHAAVRSSPRRLRVIDAATLIGQIRGELAALRQQAIRLASQQEELLSQPAQQSQAGQSQMTSRVAAQRQAVQRLAQRASRNRLDDQAVSGLIEKADQTLQLAQRESHDATDLLDQLLRKPDDAEKLTPDAQQRQRQVKRHLEDLASMLDQGRDVLTLQLQLQQMLQQQQQLTEQAMQLMPRTAGQSSGNLSPQDRQSLEQLAQQQQSLAQRGEEAVQQMRQTAESLGQSQKSPEDQAAAAALAQSASLAQKQGLSSTMQSAAQSATQNRLAEATAQQDKASDTLRQMLGEMKRQDEHQRQILRRMLVELAEAIRHLVQNQDSQIARAGEAKQLAPLEPSQELVRRNTLSVQEQATSLKTAAGAAASLGQASHDQGDAIRNMRQEDRPGVQQSQGSALAQLKTALDQVEKARQAADQEQARQKRDELRQRYEQLAKQQDDIRESTQPLTDGAARDRQRMRKLIELGGREADVQVEAGDLAKQPDIARAMLFKSLHEQLDQTTGRIVAELRQARSDAATLSRQRQVSLLLRQMAAALENNPVSEPFTDADQDQSGGSGGGGGGGEQPRSIPPIAELRLLRNLQQVVHDQTQQADGGGEAVLIDLSAQQRELAALGETLMRQLRKEPAP